MNRDHDDWAKDSTAAVLPQLSQTQEREVLALGNEQRIAWIERALGISQLEALEVWARHLGMTAMSGIALGQAQLDFDMVPFPKCQQYGCMLARAHDPDDAIQIIVHDPTDLEGQQWVESVLERARPAKLLRMLVTSEDFLVRLAQVQETLRAMDVIDLELDPDQSAEHVDILNLSLANIEVTTNSTVRLVDSTLYDALKLGASDIHFEVQNRALRIKYRLDGVLQTIKDVQSLEAAHQVISRIKVLSDLDISERRIPQDGRFRAMLEQRQIDFRVSIMPNAIGEDAVLRILDRKHLTGQFRSLTLDALSFSDDVKGFIRRAARLPYGLLLVTGPTGSGKTTTLYAALSEINTGLDKIVTIEDPIEYQLGGVLQIPVNEKKGLTFAKGLRSILRHDPDKIMVGEIRDSETAHIAVQAALTGHQVFTTVHANNVFDVIGRFSNMGVDRYSLVAALTGIMAQRLVRAVCPHCRHPEEPGHTLPTDVVDLLDTDSSPTAEFCRGAGCSHCRYTGYKGRLAVAETLALDDEMKDLLLEQAPISTVKRAAHEKGFRGLRNSAMALARQGRTTIDEVNRVTPAI